MYSKIYTAKIWLFAFSLLGGIFWFTGAHAYTIISQSTQNASYASGQSYQYGQSFTSPVNGTLSTVRMPITKTSGADFQCQLVISVPLGVNNDFGSANIAIDGSDQTVAANWRTFTWSNNPPLVAGSQYWLNTTCVASNRMQMWGSSGNVYSGGVAGSSTNRGSTITSIPGIADLTFIVDTTVTTTLISWYATPTSTCDFKVWDTVTNISDADALTYQFVGPVVTWGIFGSSSASMFNVDSQSSATSNQEDTPTSFFSANGGVVKTTPFVPGFVYSAKAHVVKDITEVRNTGSVTSANTIAQSSLWEFIVSGYPNENGCSSITQVYPSFTWPFSTSTYFPTFPNSGCVDTLDYCSGISTSSGFWADGSKALCQAVQFLFKPSCSALNNFSGLKGLVANKPPFGYIAVYSNALSGLASSTSATSSIATSTFAFTTSMTTLLSAPFFNTFQTILAIIFYIALAFYFYRRFKYFSLHG